MKTLSRGREKYPHAHYPWMYVAQEKYGVSVQRIYYALENKGFWALKTIFKDAVYRKKHRLKWSVPIIRIPGFVGTLDDLAKATGYEKGKIRRLLKAYRAGKIPIEEVFVKKETRRYTIASRQNRFNIDDLGPRKDIDNVQVGSFEKEYLKRQSDYRNYNKLNNDPSIVPSILSVKDHVSSGLGEIRVHIPRNGNSIGAL